MRLKLPVAVTFHSVINALSIPLIALLLWWTLNKVLTPSAWCPALEEFKLTNAAAIVALRCQPVLLEQLAIGKVAVLGLVVALALSHIVSVARDVKAGLDLQTKLGSVKIGGDAGQAAQETADAAQEQADAIKHERADAP